MRARGALQQAACCLRLAVCPCRIRLHPGRNSPCCYVYETCAGRRRQSARGYRIDQGVISAACSVALVSDGWWLR